jgi:hypothetical protein
MTDQERIDKLEGQVRALIMMHARKDEENQFDIDVATRHIESSADKLIRSAKAIRRADELQHELQTLKEDYPMVAEHLHKQTL